MEPTAWRDQIVELGKILFGLKLTVGETPEDTAREVFGLWFTLDKYSEALVLDWNKLPMNVRSKISQDAERVANLLKYAQDLRGCTFCKQIAPRNKEIDCEICKLRVQLLRNKLQQRQEYLVSVLHKGNALLSIQKRLYATPSEEDSLEVLHHQAGKIRDKIQDLIRERERLMSQLATNSDQDPSNAGTKPDVCEKCSCPSGTVDVLADCQLRLRRVTKELKVFKTEHAKKLKNGKNFEEAEEAYKELCDLEMGEMTEELKRDQEEARESEMRYLAYRYELVEILRQLGKNEEALPIAEETWWRREEFDKPRNGTEKLRGETKESHQQYCLLLRALGKFKDAKDEYRKVYPSAMDSDPEWAIVNGYQLGMVFLEEHQEVSEEDRYEQAGFKHWEVYEKGKQKLNLATGIMIDIAEQIILDEETLALTGRERAGRIDQVLTGAWNARGSNPSVKLLAMGHKLGVRLYNRRSYAHAAAVLHATFADRKLKVGVDNPDTLDTAESLLRAYLDDKKYDDAEIVGQWILQTRERVSSKDARETINFLHFFGSALGRGNRLERARIALKSSWERQKRAFGDEDLLALKYGWDYGEVLARLDDQETSRAELVFNEVWSKSKERIEQTQMDETERTTLISYGARLASFLEDQDCDDKYKSALQVYQELLDIVKVDPPSAEMLRFSYKVGKCQFKLCKYDESSAVLSEVWQQRNGVWLDGPEIPEDYLETGYYLCRSLLKTAKSISRRARRLSQEGRAEKAISEVIRKADEKYEGKEPESVARYHKAMSKISQR